MQLKCHLTMLSDKIDPCKWKDFDVKKQNKDARRKVLELISNQNHEPTSCFSLHLYREKHLLPVSFCLILLPKWIYS